MIEPILLFVVLPAAFSYIAYEIYRMLAGDD